MPTLLVPMSEDHNLVAKNLQILFGVVAGVTSVVFIAILLGRRFYMGLRRFRQHILWEIDQFIYNFKT